MDPPFWTGPWKTYLDQVHGPHVVDQVHGPHVVDRVHGHFLFKKEFKVEMIDKHYGWLQATKIAQK